MMTERPRPAQAAPADHKPMMTSRQIIMMNFGFFGIQSQRAPCDVLIVRTTEGGKA